MDSAPKRKDPPVHKDIFADIGDNTSLGQAVEEKKATLVHPRDRPEFAAFEMGRKKKDAMSMLAALSGKTPDVDAKGGVTWNNLDQREQTGQRTFLEHEQGTQFKQITQTRFRSGSIIETHLHVDSDDSSVQAPGATMHMDRTGRVQALDRQNHGRMAKVGLPGAVK